MFDSPVYGYRMKRILLMIVFVLAPLGADEKPVLRFSPEVTELKRHSEARVEVWIDRVRALKGYSVQFTYDAAKVRISHIHIGTMFASPAFFASFIDSLGGTIKVESVLLGGGRSVDGSGILFSIDVYAMGHGTDTLSFTDVHLRNVDLERIEAETNTGILIIGDPVGVNSQYTNVRSFQLFQNYPNPFNFSTHIRFYIPYAGAVSAQVYSTDGREVLRVLDGERFIAGMHEITIDAAGLPSGIYFCRVEAAVPERGMRYIGVIRTVFIR
jgi:hypothetical protein